MSTGHTARLAAFITEMTADVIDANVLARCPVPIVDTIGVMLAGRSADIGTPMLEHTRRFAVARGGAWVVGLAEPVLPEAAALANATLGHALDYDDSLPGSGHPSSLVLAAILATASELGHPLTGRDLVAAYAVGFEVAARVAKALGRAHTVKGWHVTATAGSFGAAAAACRVLGLDEPEVRNALGIAASHTAGMVRNFGTATKPLHSGIAARNGVTAALLTRAGVSATHDIFDGERGFFDLYGLGDARPSELDRLGAPFALVDPGTALKKYPCCYTAARPIDAVLRLRSEHGIVAADVASIECRVPTGGMHTMMYHDAQDGHEARFCFEYLLAAAVVDGDVTLQNLTDEAVRRPEVRELMPRVVALDDPTLRPEDPTGRHSSAATGGWVRVSIRCRDGREFSTTQSEPHGGPRNPFTAADVAAKFRGCARYGGFPPEESERLLAELLHIDQCADVLATLRRLPALSGER